MCGESPRAIGRTARASRACSMRLRCPTEVTPMASRSSSSRVHRTAPSTSCWRKACSYAPKFASRRNHSPTRSTSQPATPAAAVAGSGAGRSVAPGRSAAPAPGGATRPRPQLSRRCWPMDEEHAAVSVPSDACTSAAACDIARAAAASSVRSELRSPTQLGTARIHIEPDAVALRRNSGWTHAPACLAPAPPPPVVACRGE